ncbi:hypothetical protein MLD38_011434 [Melastoma candidum]|uniref:Uncharacterized protein n=1 Tax=Melastoma candidum TaxID=119954 RepID=A0ACB9R467_9MYRT|nr:hypothetical protein MLD38_011434 [Melastoma candidum]
MFLVLSWCLTLNTMWQMIQLHECIPGKRFEHYLDLGQYDFGPKLGAWIVLPQQLIVQVGCNIVYMVIGGKCLKEFTEVACTNCTRIRQSYWICMFSGVQFLLSQLPNFDSVVGVSLAAAVMSLGYSTMAWVGSLAHGRAENVSYAYKDISLADSVFRIFNALGQISFAFAGHAIALELQATIPSTPGRPSKVPMWKGAIGAYFVNAICYFPVALIGYWAFGRDVADNVIMELRKPAWIIATANLMVVVHVVGSYQVYAMPVFDMVERTMMKRFHFPPGFALKLVARTAYVGMTPFTLFLGVTSLSSETYSHNASPNQFLPQLPSIIWLIIMKPAKFSGKWFINWISIFIGVFIMFASTIGGLRNIIADASTYRLYT